MLISIALHELGHLFTYAYVTGRPMKRIKFKYNQGSIKLKIPNSISNNNYAFILMVGVFVGMVPLMFLFEYFSVWVVVLAFASYIYGSRNDITKIGLYYKTKKQRVSNQ